MWAVRKVSVVRRVHSRLTVKLRGRSMPPDQSRGRTISSRARGDTTEHHGTLQRLLEGECHHCARGNKGARIAPAIAPYIGNNTNQSCLAKPNSRPAEALTAAPMSAPRKPRRATLDWRES